MELTERQAKILDIIKRYRFGVGFNELARYAKSFASRPTVRKELQVLLSQGEVVRIGGERRGTQAEYFHKSVADLIQSTEKIIRASLPSFQQSLDAWKKKPTLETLEEIAPGFLEKIFYYMAIRDSSELKEAFILEFGYKFWKAYHEAGEYLLRAVNSVPAVRREFHKRRAQFLRQSVAPLLEYSRTQKISKQG